MAIITVKNRAITLDAAEIPNLDASKITTGTFDASKIGSGTFADARIAASNVSQHATSFDDNKIVNDISTLGLRVHTQENLNASNSNSASFDVFQDSSAISNLTNCARNSGEFMSSVVETIAAFTADSDTALLYHFDDLTESKHGDSNVVTGPHFELSTAQKKFGTKSARNYNIDQSYGYHAANNRFQVGTGALTVEGWCYPVGGSDSYAGMVGRWWTDGNIFDVRYQSGDAGGNFSVHDSTSIRNSGVAFSTNTWSHFAWTRDGSGNNALWLNGVQKTTWSNQNSMSLGTKDLLFGVTDSGTGYHYNGYLDEIRLSTVERYTSTFTPNSLITTNATGSFTGNNITASSSTNKMGAVITYQDNAGTNTLNTDIVLQLSADGGSNYSTATLTALPDFATGIKMAKVNDLSVTAGTSLNYKISFANQASGSKEARIRGVSLQY
jgi:hypothetical protein